LRTRVLALRLSHLAHAQQGVTGHYLIEAGNGVFSSLGLFETSEQGEESTKVVSTWIKDEHPRVCSAERARLAAPSRFIQD
jgi:hypothetical protein